LSNYQLPYADYIHAAGAAVLIQVYGGHRHVNTPPPSYFWKRLKIKKHLLGDITNILIPFFLFSSSVLNKKALNNVQLKCRNVSKCSCCLHPQK
jgi:hypothetical protein